MKEPDFTKTIEENGFETVIDIPIETLVKGMYQEINVLEERIAAIETGQNLLAVYINNIREQIEWLKTKTNGMAKTQ